MDKNLIRYGYSNSSNKDWLEFKKKNHKENRKLDSSCYHDILLIPDTGTGVGTFNGGGFNKAGKPVPAFFQRKGIESSKELFKKGYVENAEVINEKVVYLGQIRNHWGSFLFDSITRLWYLKENPTLSKYVFLKTNVESGEIHENCLHFLELYGISKEQVYFIDKPTWLSEVIVPDLSLYPFEKWNNKYLDTIFYVVDQASISADLEYEKVYFSRAKFSKKYKSDFGNELICDFFRINGFKIIYPEELTLDEQISVVNQCKVFASVCGAGAHNVIFSKNRPQTVLVKRMNGYQEHQWFFDEMAGVEPVTYIDAYCEPFKHIYRTTMGGPYLFLINKNIRLYAKDNNMKLPKRWPIRNVFAFIRYSVACVKSVGFRLKKRIQRNI